eukprot:1116231-Rhodomonas_salina.2
MDSLLRRPDCRTRKPKMQCVAGVQHGDGKRRNERSGLIYTAKSDASQHKLCSISTSTMLWWCFQFPHVARQAGQRRGARAQVSAGQGVVRTKG